MKKRPVLEGSFALFAFAMVARHDRAPERSTLRRSFCSPDVAREFAYDPSMSDLRAARSCLAVTFAIVLASSGCGAPRPLEPPVVPEAPVQIGDPRLVLQVAPPRPINTVRVSRSGAVAPVGAAGSGNAGYCAMGGGGPVGAKARHAVAKEATRGRLMAGGTGR